MVTCSTLYGDETVGHLLRSPSYAQLHAKYPVELAYMVDESEVIVLLRQPPRWDAAGLQSTLGHGG